MSLSPLVPVKTNRVQPMHLQHSVAPSTPRDLHPYGGSCSHPHLKWAAELQLPTPSTAKTSHGPTKTSSLRCGIPPSAAWRRLSTQTKGELWFLPECLFLFCVHFHGRLKPSFGPPRFHRQLSDPCLPFLPPEKTPNPPYHPSSCDGRPLYQRHLSEPVVPLHPRGFKEELVDPRYPDPGPAGPSLAPPQANFNHVKIKQEPRDYSFEPGMFKVLVFLLFVFVICIITFGLNNLCHKLYWISRLSLFQRFKPASRHLESLQFYFRKTLLVSSS